MFVIELELEEVPSLKLEVSSQIKADISPRIKYRIKQVDCESERRMK